MALNGPQTIGTAVGAALIAVVDYRVLIVSMGVVIAACALPIAARRTAAEQRELVKKPLDLRVDMKVYASTMTTGYQIKDVSERTGFSAATLRYYEEIGLLPPSTRTAAGYRIFDDATLARLAFIARAKQLGCSLDEIADLTTAWEGGRCGPIQDRLRTVVADKLESAQRQIVELMTLSADLQRAAATLELHRPDGPCDDRCGCVTDRPGGRPTFDNRSRSAAKTHPTATCRDRMHTRPGVDGQTARSVAGIARPRHTARIDRRRSTGRVRRGDAVGRTDAAHRRRTGLLPVLRLRDHRRSPRNRVGGSGPGRCAPHRSFAVRSCSMSSKKQDLVLVGAGAAACAVCCAAPILGFFAAIGLGTVLGVAAFGAIGLCIALIGVIVLMRRRRRQATRCRTVDDHPVIWFDETDDPRRQVIAGRLPTMTQSIVPSMGAPTTGGISLRGLTKTFRGPAGPVHAVRGIDIEISPGETVALLGPNGAGKSTTIDMLLGLTKPDAGDVHLFEKSPTAARLPAARSERCCRRAPCSVTSACASSST